MATPEYNPNDDLDTYQDPLFIPLAPSACDAETNEDSLRSALPATRSIAKATYDEPLPLATSKGKQGAQLEVAAMSTTVTKDSMKKPYLPPFPPSNAIILDPNNSERQYHRDPLSQLQREIWRPGDRDGDPAADYFQKPGDVPIERRWRFYQSSTNPDPIERGLNEPPKYVVLDDQAAYEVLMSNLPRQLITKYWSHDFGGHGTVRMRRSHRGRGAHIVPLPPPTITGTAAVLQEDSDVGEAAKVAAAMDDERLRFHSVSSGPNKTNRMYYFTGEKDYRPIHYADPQSQDTRARSFQDDTPAESLSRKRKASNELDESLERFLSACEQGDSRIGANDHNQRFEPQTPSKKSNWHTTKSPSAGRNTETCSLIESSEDQLVEARTTIDCQKMKIANLEKMVYILQEDLQTARRSAGRRSNVS